MSQQMTHKEFCCWLEGFFMRGGETPTAEQWQMIGVRLQKVLNPVVTVGGVRDVTSKIADYMEKCGQQVPVPHQKPVEMPRDTRTVGFRKFNLDECSQGEQKRNEDTPIKTIADLARESLINDITPAMVMADLPRQVESVQKMIGVPFHTPQEPFKGEGC